MNMKVQCLLHTGNEQSHPDLSTERSFSWQRLLTLASWLTSLLGVTGSRVPTPRCDQVEGVHSQILILLSRCPKPATEAAGLRPSSHHQDPEKAPASPLDLTSWPPSKFCSGMKCLHLLTLQTSAVFRGRRNFIFLTTILRSLCGPKIVARHFP